MKNYDNLKIANEEDKLFIAKIINKLEQRDLKNKITSTDFLNLHEKRLCEDLIKKEKIKNYKITGCYEDAERTVVIFYPDKLENYIDRYIDQLFCVIRIELPKFQNKYTHRDYLGGIMKLGIKREKIGDIMVFDDGADIIVGTDIADYLIDELKKLTRFKKSNIKKVSIMNLRIATQNKECIELIVSSYRIDTILSEILRISRTKATQIIKEERVFINSVLCINPSKNLLLNDIITIRGKGKFELKEECGCTKKGNIKIIVLKYV